MIWERRSTRAHLHQQGAGLITANARRQPSLSTAAQAELLNQCWGVNLVKHEVELKPFQSYILHYTESCHHLPDSMQGFTHGDICAVVQHLANNTNQSHDSIIRTLPLPVHPLADPKQCINFVGRAVLLLDLGRWQGSHSLPDFIQPELACASTQKDQFRLPISFNARTFEHIAGIKIVWTHSLSSHLKIGSDMELLSIFHHAKVLDLYQESRFNSIFPEHFIEETRQTLALMLPKGNKACKRWFRSHQEKHGLDVAAATCPYLGEDKRSAQMFTFWRDRLIHAKEVFDEGRPGSILQLWRDDRNKVQWLTFWIAIVVFCFSAVTVVEGALQVYKAYYPA